MHLLHWGSLEKQTQHLASRVVASVAVALGHNQAWSYSEHFIEGTHILNISQNVTFG